MNKKGPPGPRPNPRPRKIVPQRPPPADDLYTLAIRDVSVGDKRYRVFFRTELATIDRISGDAVITHLDGKTLEAAKPTIYIETREVLADEEQFVVKKVLTPAKKKRKASRK